MCDHLSCPPLTGNTCSFIQWLAVCAQIRLTCNNNHKVHAENSRHKHQQTTEVSRDKEGSMRLCYMGLWLYLTGTSLAADAPYRVILADDTTARPLPLQMEVVTVEVFMELKRKLEDLISERKNDRNVITELEKELAEYRESSTENAKDIMGLKDEVKDCQNRMKLLERDVQKNNLEIQRLSSLESDIHRHNLDIQHLTYQQNQAEKSVKKCCDFQEKSKNLMAKLDKRIRHLRKFSDLLLQKITHVTDNYTEFERQLSVIHNTTTDLLTLKSEAREGTNVFFYDHLATVDHGSGQLEGEYFISNIGNSEDTKLTIEGSGDETGSGHVSEENTRTTSDNFNIDIQAIQTELKSRDIQIAILQTLYDRMYEQMIRLESKMSSIELGDFMSRLQQSVTNITQNVITVEQWRVASSHIVNSTQTNNNNIMQLTQMIVNNSNKISELDWKLSNIQLLAQQQFNVLRMHIIQMNNTFQDMKEKMEKTTPDKPLYTNSLPGADDAVNLKSRLDNLALQMVFSDNRVSKLESNALNESLLNCYKHGTDMYQDNLITRNKQEISQTRETTILLKDMVKRLDHGLYVVHSNTKNNTEIIKQLEVYAKIVRRYIPIIEGIQVEISHFKKQLPIDCHGHFVQGYRESGVYVIHPFNATKSIQVYCQFQHDEAWTVIQHREDGSVSFSRTWAEYKKGFGSANGEYWIGNSNLHLLTSYMNYTLQVDMVDIMGGHWLAQYENFVVSDEENNYRLSVSSYHGNSTDGLSYSDGMSFSTMDHDNDLSSTHCAEHYTAGWWYKHCQYSNLNGRYHIGIIWYNKAWNDWIQLTQTTMKIKLQTG